MINLKFDLSNRKCDLERKKQTKEYMYMAE